MYNKNTKQREEETIKVRPSDVIIIDGHLIFCNEELRNLIDLKVYIDTDNDVRLSRKLLKLLSEK